VEDLRDKANTISQEDGEITREKHHARGKMMSKECIKMLLDPDSSFMELSQFAAY